MSDTVANGNTVILGVGSLLMRDEGVGVHAANQLERLSLPEGVEVREGGTDGFKLINIILKAGRLILVDAVKGGGEPATLYRFDVTDYREVPDKYKTSVHQIGMYDVITMAGLVGTPPRTTIIGVEPAEISMSMDLSDPVRAKLPRICELALEAAGVDPTPYRERLSVYHPLQMTPARAG